MKIEKQVQVLAEVSVEIGVSDVRLAMQEAFSVVTTDGPANRAEILYAINTIAIFLKAITDAQISLLTFGQLDRIQHFLLEQHNRFNTPLLKQAAFERGEKAEA